MSYIIGLVACYWFVLLFLKYTKIFDPLQLPCWWKVLFFLLAPITAITVLLVFIIDTVDWMFDEIERVIG